MYIKNVLKIAGCAHRELLSVQRKQNKEEHAFPKGPDWIMAQRAAIYESITCNCRALLASSFYELSFNEKNKAVAKAPDALKGTEWENPTIYEY